MKMKTVLVVFFLTLGLSLRLSAYEISIQKYSTGNKKNYCFELYEHLFNKPYNREPSNRFIPTAQFICNERVEGKNLLAELHQVEFNNRLIYKSHEITMSLLNKANILVETQKYFLRAAKKTQLDCRGSSSSECLIASYLMKQEAGLLLIDYDRLSDEIFQISMSCSKEDISQVGCHEEVVTDPYLQSVKVKTILSPANSQVLKRALAEIKNAKGKLESQLRSISQKRVRQ